MTSKTANKKKSTYKSSILRKPGTKILPSRERAQSKYFFFSSNPISKTFLDDLAEELVEWAENNPQETAYKAFLVMKQIPVRTFNHWIHHKNGKKLEIALSIAKQIIGVTREKGINTGTLNFNAIRLTQYLYDDDFDSAQRREAKIKAEYQDKDKAETTVIVMDSFQLKKDSDEKKHN